MLRQVTALTLPTVIAASALRALFGPGMPVCIPVDKQDPEDALHLFIPVADRMQLDKVRALVRSWAVTRQQGLRRARVRVTSFVDFSLFTNQHTVVVRVGR